MPSVDFGLEFRLPFPEWFICGSNLKLLQQDSQKLAKRVVPTKHTLDSFKGHLHVDIEHVHILSPMHKGVE